MALIEDIILRRIFKESPYVIDDEFRFKVGTLGVRREEMRSLKTELKTKNLIREEIKNGRLLIWRKSTKTD